MNKILISGIELTTTNEGEILRMGGPWVGDVSIGTDLISKDCNVDNFLYNQDLNLLFFVKYHQINYYQYFTINFYNISTKTVYEFEREFDMVHLGEFKSKNELEIYPAFHDKFKNIQIIFNLDDEDFSQVL
ncbi:MAG: hypothetical protein ACXVB0_20665 [Mucilaginibacter sp.]